MLGDGVHIQCGNTGRARSGVGSTIPHHTSQIGSSGLGGRASKCSNKNKHFRRGREGDDQPSQGQNKPPSGPATAGLPFACPFYCHDKEEHQNCLSRRLRRIGDVRQHLKRCHMQASWCPRCGVIFRNDRAYAQRNEHISSCETYIHPSPPPPPGMTGEQLIAMTDAARHRRGSNDEGRWYEIWDIMFPGERRPLSPYINVASEWRRLGARAAVTQYLQEDRLSQFMTHNLNGIDLRYTLELLLEDVRHAYNHAALPNHDLTHHPNVDFDNDDDNSDGGDDGDDGDDNDELDYLQDS